MQVVERREIHYHSHQTFPSLHLKYIQHLSRVTTKPTKCVCDQHGSRPACASAQSDQDPCCSLTNPIASRETDSEHHGSLSDCPDAHAGLDPCLSQRCSIFVATSYKNKTGITSTSKRL
jgi:hypothetical protein